jgi:hypothetical protein
MQNAETFILFLLSDIIPPTRELVRLAALAGLSGKEPAQ